MASSGLAAALFTGGIALPHIAAHGTPDQVDAFVRPDARRARRSARSRSPSPVAAPTSRAITHDRRTRRRPYVVNGAKTFITSGVRADFVTTAVRTGGPGHAGVSLLVVEKGTPGFTVDRSLSKMGWHCSDTAELSFVDARVPVANLVGEENTGFYLIAEQFVVERIALAVHAYGIAARSLALTAAYCRERETFGQPLIANQVVQHKLVEMHRRVDVARTYTRDVAARHVAGEQRASPRPAWPSRPPSRRATTSSTRPCSCTAAPATCTGPRWSGTTATPGSSASEEERPRCSPTCPPDCWGTRHDRDRRRTADRRVARRCWRSSPTSTTEHAQGGGRRRGEVRRRGTTPAAS